MKREELKINESTSEEFPYDTILSCTLNARLTVSRREWVERAEGAIDFKKYCEDRVRGIVMQYLYGDTCEKIRKRIDHIHWVRNDSSGPIGGTFDALFSKELEFLQGLLEDME